MITYQSLETDADWDSLRKQIFPHSHPVGDKLIDQLQALSAKVVLLESEYLDRDYSESYSAFYSKVYRRHNRTCKRFHFFDCGLEALATSQDAEARSKAIEDSANNYLGFVVARPVPHAPLSHAVIKPTPSKPDCHCDLLVHADYEVHILGASLKITGTPLTQQDSRVGACAQASLWTVGRHMHVRHRGPWISTVSITESASISHDLDLARQLPAGSAFLTPSHMTMALRKMGRQAFFYVADDPKSTPKVWSPNLRPEDVIHRYVDSGIPVILGLGPQSGAIGHAVVATGTINVSRPESHPLPEQPTRSVFVDSILINDDQGGANLKAAICNNSVHGEVGWCIEDRLQYLIIPLPDKVYMSAEQAELLARNSLDNYEHNWAQLKNSVGLGASVEAAAKFLDAKKDSRLIARTYLTFGYRYKERAIKNDISPAFKNEIIQKNFPRYVWVTEFGDFSAQNHLDKYQQRVSAHVVIDATASVLWEAELAMHAPGFWLVRSHDETRPYGEYVLNWGLISDDRQYRPKIRGS